MKNYYILAGLVLLAAGRGIAQVKIGAAGAPDASAMLEVTSGTTGNKGLLLPRMTTAQRNAIAEPATGLLIYNTTVNEVQANTGTPASPAWVTATATGWNTTGNAGSNPATNFIGTTDNQPLVFRTNNTEKARITTTGLVGIGTTAPAVKLHVDTGGLRVSNGSTALPGPAIQVINDGGGTGNNDNIVIASYGNSTQPSIGTVAARGTAGAPANSQAGDNIGNFYFNARANGVEAAQSRIASTYLGNGSNSKSNMSFYTSNALAMTIDSANNVGIGTGFPQVRLHLNGGILFGRDKNPSYGNGTFIVWSTVRTGIGETEFINYRGTGAGGFRFYDVDPGTSTGTAVFGTNSIAFIDPTGEYTTTSDMRVKTEVHVVSDGLKKVMAMRPVSYDFHTGRTLKDGVVSFTKGDRPIRKIGFLAQELAKVVPEAVTVPKDPANELYNVSYATVVPVLTKAIQEQQAEIEMLKAELATVKAANTTLKADASKVSALAERMQQLEALLGTKATDKTTTSK